ncbi:hypothetical protein [Chromobacterium subtsugae]|nr:hypothetical protein [Chromobacterium subtsugae]OBU85252.1 hypothetical protein MY55_17255 [Chromobacterium subtsugae]
MGQLNIVNCLGVPADFNILNKHDNTYTRTLAMGLAPFTTSQNQDTFSGKNASSFSDIQIIVHCPPLGSDHPLSYTVDLNRDHYFGDNEGAYPGNDYDIELIFMGFNNAKSQILLMQAYRKANSGGPYILCTDQKRVSRP